MTTISEFKVALDEANAAIALREAEIRQKESENQLLREKIRLLQFRQFGKSSERLDSDN